MHSIGQLPELPSYFFRLGQPSYLPAKVLTSEKIIRTAQSNSFFPNHFTCSYNNAKIFLDNVFLVLLCIIFCSARNIWSSRHKRIIFFSLLKPNMCDRTYTGMTKRIRKLRLKNTLVVSNCLIQFRDFASM